MLRLRAAAAVIVVVVGAVVCGGSPPVELRTAAAPVAVVLADVPRPGDRPAPAQATTTTTTASTTSTTVPTPPSTTSTVPAPATPAAAPEQVGGYVNGYPCGGDLPTCHVLACESGGNPSARNPRSSASGAWQITDGTWAGFGGYAEAWQAPPAVQNAKAAVLWDGGAGRRHWSSCL